jgi:hypothetical protein
LKHDRLQPRLTWSEAMQPVAICPTNIFISHSSADQRQARELRADLMNVDLQALGVACGMPREMAMGRFMPWIFEVDLPFGNDLADGVRRAINECDVFLVTKPYRRSAMTTAVDKWPACA